MAKLYELLAVESDRRSQTDRQSTKTVQGFTTKENHFKGIKRTFRPFAVNEELGEDGGERLEAETRLVTTVHQALHEYRLEMTRLLDVTYQIDDGNTRAKADLVVDGETIAKDVPATYLLQLEKRLRNIRGVLEKSPTFDPVRLWTKDDGADLSHVLRAEPVVTIRKQKSRKYHIMYEATKDHPAQVDIHEVDEPVGEIRSYEWTGMISPGKKQALLGQVDTLLVAIKQARSKANSVEVNADLKIGNAIFDFLFKPLN